ncbi:hypothetical protein PIB30_055477, partial [Stylosanthes scabra]|nr:hypothetical protein [Stylosanthes scabra]
LKSPILSTCLRPSDRDAVHQTAVLATADLRQLLTSLVSKRLCRLHLPQPSLTPFPPPRAVVVAARYEVHRSRCVCLALHLQAPLSPCSVPPSSPKTVPAVPPSLLEVHSARLLLSLKVSSSSFLLLWLKIRPSRAALVSRLGW